jgi:hypothetical protein
MRLFIAFLYLYHVMLNAQFVCDNLHVLVLSMILPDPPQLETKLLLLSILVLLNDYMAAVLGTVH